MINKPSFLQRLLSELPEAQEVVAEHLDDQDGELLLHLLMSDLLRFGVALYQGGKIDEAQRLLGFMDRCLLQGDEYVQNAVQVSFVEHYGYGPNEPESFLDLWPVGLRAELER